ncbi:amidohydrolase family protein [Robiginitalea marina]|uniref:Amidohydrolase family protein n=1 Tax=Robiginitalea marina TaxID=2954105 RepID=A0ABT1AWE0_9FLAO|nr:amidohydrolase family protein [Robiginitalea marina]MCO5723523.1 amidohydrolase family protein [Robiginitalea marina]
MKKHPKFPLLLLTLLPWGLIGQEMSFEEYNPASTLVVPQHPVTRARYPFVDIHSHHPNMASQDLSPVVAAMDSLNLAVLVNLSGGTGDRLRDAVNNSRTHYPGRFLVFANVDFDGVGGPGWGERAAAQLETDVRNGASGLKIFKSLGLRNRDSEGKRIPVDDPRLDPIWEKCADLGIPVLIHSADPKSFWDPMDGNNERWLELKTRPGRKRSDTDPAPWQQLIDEQHRLFRKHPRTIFINAHMGWYANDLERLGLLLEEFPNMYVGIAAVIAELGRQPRMARDFFIRYQDRILFGKDSWQPSEFPTYFRVLETADEYFPYHKKYHAFWAMYGLDLPDTVLKKVYFKNAMKLLPAIAPEHFEGH